MAPLSQLWCLEFQPLQYFLVRVLPRTQHQVAGDCNWMVETHDEPQMEPSVDPDTVLGILGSIHWTRAVWEQLLTAVVPALCEKITCSSTASGLKSTVSRSPSPVVSPALTMEVTCLNGASVSVEPWESLQEAKVKVAKALGAFPEAVQISCEGHILRGLETLEICLEKLKKDTVQDAVEDFDGNCHGHPPLFGVVDQMRRELARNLRHFEPELVATQKQLAKMEKKKAELGQKQKELCVCGYHSCCAEVLKIELRLKEGNLSLHEEKALVSRLPKLKSWSKMEIELDQEYDKLRLLQRELKKKISDGRDALQKALKSQDAEPDSLLAEFDGVARAREPERFRFGYTSSDYYYDPYLEEERLMFAEIASGKIAQELKDLVPRLLRREAWSNSKKSWKYSRKPPPAEECDKRKGRTALSSRQRRGYGHVLRRDVSNQLQEYSLEAKPSGLKH